MTRLYLHIGQSKTGTSFLQHCLRSNVRALAALDIAYPERPLESPEDPSVKISSGNGRGVLRSPEALGRSIEGHTTNLLFSSEFLFEEILGTDDASWIPLTARECGFDQVEVLLFVRNPLGHAASVWQQGIKRGGMSRPIEDVYATFDAPERALRVLRRLRDAGLTVTVVNYSRVDSVLGEFERWLGVPSGSLEADVTTVNRSLTFAETELQLALNRALGQRASVVADLLVDRLPELDPDERRPSLDVQQRAWDRMLPTIREFESWAPPEAHYRCDARPYEGHGEAGLTTEQLDVVADAIRQLISSGTEADAALATSDSEPSVDESTMRSRSGSGRPDPSRRERSVLAGMLSRSRNRSS